MPAIAPALRQAPDVGLVAQAGEALVFAQHGQHVENRRRGGAAGERGPQRLRHGAELEPRALGKGRGPPLRSRRQSSRSTASSSGSSAAISALGLGASAGPWPGRRVERAVAQRKRVASNSSTRVLARSFKARHGGDAACSRSAGVILPASSCPPAMCGSSCSSSAIRSASRAGADVVAVEVFELGEIEARRRAADLRQIESGDHLLGGENLLVAMRPAEADQIIAHRRRQIAHRPVGIDAERAVALGQLGAVRPVDQRDMRHDRHVPAERLVDLLLAGARW